MNYLSPINSRYPQSPFSNSLFSNWESEFEKLFGSLPSLFDVGSEQVADSDHRSLTPRWYENDNAFVARIDLPGVNAKDVALEVGDNVLTLAADRKTRSDSGETSEFSFRQSLSIPDGIDADKVTASYEDGVLSVTLPKTEIVKPRRIKVS